MLRLAVRVLDFLQRFAIGISNLGVLGASKVFIIYRSRGLEEPASIQIRKLNRRFYFRGAADRGVMSHFYKAGYRIRDDHSREKVRFIIDAGANIGDETVRFRYFHPTAKIIALEPEINNFRLLQRNMMDDRDCILLNRGLWSKTCKLRIIPGTVNENFRVEEIFGASEDYDLWAISIPEIMDQYEATEIDILKMDIEGAEAEVFRGATEEWLSKVKVFIFECPDYDAPGTTMLIFERLLQAGQMFRSYLHGENIVLIRQDVDWRLESDLFFER